MKTELLTLLLAIVIVQLGQSQDSSAGNTDNAQLRLINLQSTKVLEQGDLCFTGLFILGSPNEDKETFFDMNSINANFQIIYGMSDGLQIGLSRESFRKTFSGHIKVALVEQTGNSSDISSSCTSQRSTFYQYEYPNPQLLSLIRKNGLNIL